MLSENSPSRFDLSAVDASLRYCYELNHQQVNLLLMQKRHNRNLQNYGIASLVSFLILMAICYFARANWVFVPFASSEWWATNASLMFGLVLYFYWQAGVNTRERAVLKAFIASYRAAGNLLHKWGHKNESVPTFVSNKLLELHASGKVVELTLGKRIFAPFGIGSPACDEDLGDDDLSHVASYY